MNRNSAIDLSRAIAVILVTLFHVTRGPILPTIKFGCFDLFGFMRNGWVGVGIFFIISGYCMGMSAKRDFSEGVTLGRYGKYLLKRFLRIAPPYYIAIAVWVFIINKYHIAMKPTGFNDIVTHVTFTHNLFADTFFSISGVFWSIGVEMQFYLILPLIIIVCRSGVCSAIVLFISFVTSIYIYGTDLGISYKWGLLNYLFLFIYGWALFTYQSKITIVVDKLKLSYVSVILFVGLILYVGSDYTNEQKIYEAIISILFGVIMIKMNDMDFLKRQSSLLNVFLLIGKASFSIYLYNYIYNIIEPKNNSLFALLFMFAGVIGVGVFMYLLIELNTERVRYKLLKSKKDIIAPIV